LRHANPFARIAVDQTTEETVNKDTQTARGTRGFSFKPGPVSHYYLTAEHCTAALRQLREQSLSTLLVLVVQTFRVHASREMSLILPR
ncbi:hypothetical protein SK128_008387, partial [Halocaridina rubra]